jgi:hypothetical protein
MFIADNQREPIALVFNKGSGVISTWAFNSFKHTNIILERISNVNRKMLVNHEK